MIKSVLAVALMSASSLVMAQAVQGDNQSGQLNLKQGGVQIKGNTDIKANAADVNAVATGEGNVAKNSVGAIKGGTQIQGNTKINASAKGMNAVAAGKNNRATNDVGAIGGN